MTDKIFLLFIVLSTLVGTTAAMQKVDTKDLDQQQESQAGDMDDYELFQLRHKVCNQGTLVSSLLNFPCQRGMQISSCGGGFYLFKNPWAVDRIYFAPDISLPPLPAVVMYKKNHQPDLTRIQHAEQQLAARLTKNTQDRVIHFVPISALAHLIAEYCAPKVFAQTSAKVNKRHFSHGLKQ